MEKPKVSVIMPVYNGEKFLREAIESILSQTFQNYEFIIIDDGSTDGTADLLNEYQDRRIRMIQNEKNLGITHSLNTCLEKVRGDYIARQDADDISFPTRIEKQVRMLDTNRSLGLVSSSFHVMDDTGKRSTTVYVLSNEKTIRNVILDHNPFCHGAAMFRKEAVDILGGYRGYFKYAQDYDLWLRISERYDVTNLDEILYSWRTTSGSVTEKSVGDQCRFAMAAIQQAKKRMEGYTDDIDRGTLPPLPDLEHLTKGLRKQLRHGHNPAHMSFMKIPGIKRAVSAFRNCIRSK